TAIVFYKEFDIVIKSAISCARCPSAQVKAYKSGLDQLHHSETKIGPDRAVDFIIQGDGRDLDRRQDLPLFVSRYDLDVIDRPVSLNAYLPPKRIIFSGDCI